MTRASQPKPAAAAAALGARHDDLDTPYLALDLAAFEANVARFAGLCAAAGKQWRPHAKGHKSVEIARRLVTAGAIGATCAKLSEAEIMAAGGIGELLVANQVVGPLKWRRLVELCRTANPVVAVDHVEQVAPLAALARRAGVAPPVVIEVDLGLGRAGVPPGPAVLALARQIQDLPPVRLAGVMGYEGHLLTLADPVEKERRIRQSLATLAAQAEELRQAGFECPVVSAGGTGSSVVALDCPGISELQAGGVIFMDAFYRQACQVREFDFALSLWTTVTSRPVRERAILDAGRKAQNVEIHAPWFPEYPHLRVTQTSAEHCRVEWHPGEPAPALGERLRVVPGYADLTCALYDRLHVFQDGRLAAVWPLDAHGAVT